MRSEAHVHIGRARKGLNDCISVRDLPTGRVRYVNWLLLTDATFAVQPAGARRFRETGQKNVHAFVRGANVYEDTFSTLDNDTGHCLVKGDADWREALYRPGVNETFIDKASGFPVHRARRAVLVGKRVFYVLH